MRGLPALGPSALRAGEKGPRLKLQLSTRIEQQQILAPQLILSMDILQLNSMDLAARVEKEFMENPALEMTEPTALDPELPNPGDSRDPELKQLFDLLDTYESRYGGDDRPRSSSVGADNKHEALANHADVGESLSEFLCAQISDLELEDSFRRVCQKICDELDPRGYLHGETEEIAACLGVSSEQVERALEVIQGLDPCGVGARDLAECLLLQLGEGDELEHRIVRDCLQDLLENRLPRVAETLSASLDDVKEAVSLLRTLQPYPGSPFVSGTPQQVRPEIFVDEVDGRYVVQIEESTVPRMRVSPACAALLREDGQNPKVLEYVRRKVESARWLLHAVDQRHRTLADIAQAVVDHQQDFFHRGPGHLSALTMQTIATQVGVHISTVSRAANGKYIQTPFGSMELRRFFTGGVERTDGGIESRDNVCGVIREMVAEEDSRRPLSDSQLTRRLQERGIDIARRTVSKYRERAGVPQARLRKRY